MTSPPKSAASTRRKCQTTHHSANVFHLLCNTGRLQLFPANKERRETALLHIRQQCLSERPVQEERAETLANSPQGITTLLLQRYNKLAWTKASLRVVTVSGIMGRKSTLSHGSHSSPLVVQGLPRAVPGVTCPSTSLWYRSCHSLRLLKKSPSPNRVLCSSMVAMMGNTLWSPRALRIPWGQVLLQATFTALLPPKK